MKKEQAINNFVRKNYRIIKEKENFDKKRFNDVKKYYFANELKHKFGIPRDKEICDCFVEITIKAQKISDQPTLENIISETPLLRLNNIQADNYICLIDSISKKFSLKENIKDLKEVDKMEKMEAWIKKQKTKEIDKLIAEKEKEYRSLPSILDDTDFEEPEEPPEDVEFKPWWEDLSLREDPFPGALDGFSLINKSLYDEIIVETEPINWALRNIKKEQIDIFHKGYLLGGEFGTGKTTFYDYITPHLIISHIEPIRIALSDNISVAYYLQKFEKTLCLRIAKLIKKYDIKATARNIDFEEAQLLMLEIQERGVKGFFIFLDDLHKHSDTNIVFNFLSNLQIIKNNFSREGINVVLMVSGFPSWRIRIKQDSALTSFFDAPDKVTLPEVTPMLAAQAIKKRLTAFSINPEKTLTVKEEFLNTIFKKVSTEIGFNNIGFRPYIQEAVNNFQKKKFDILSLDFTKLDKSIMKEIRQKLEANIDFKKGIDKLIFGGGIKKREVREKTLKVLCQIYLNKGVPEGDELFDDNKFSFKRLNESELIQKYDRNGNLIWKESPFLNSLNKKIIEQFNLSIEDYLVPIYSTPTQKIKEEKETISMIEDFKQDLKKWKATLETPIAISLSSSLEMYLNYIFPFTELAPKKQNSIYDANLIENVKKCIWSMMKCIIRYESPALLDICGEANIEGWKLRHRTLEAASHFIVLEQALHRTRDEKADITRIISFANDAFCELWSEFKKCINIYDKSFVKCYELPQDILNYIYSEYNNLFLISQPRDEYLESLDAFVDKIEGTLRKYLHISCSLIFGPPHLRNKFYPDDIKKYISSKDASSPVTSYECYNEFENLNRGQYRYLFLQSGKSSEFYRFIIKPLINKWDSQDITSFFELFGDINIITSHGKNLSVEDRKKDIPTFFRLACRLIASISTRLRELVLFNNTIITNNNQTLIVFGFQYEKAQQIKKTINIGESDIIPKFICQHDITSLLKTSGINAITENPDNKFRSTELNLMEFEETTIKFNTKYSETISLIANSLVNNEVRVITLYGTNIAILKTN